MFSGNTRGCASIYNYAAAERHFNREPAPRGKAWSPHQRPLDNARKWHYRLEKHDDGAYYDVCLYHTTMARFHRPEPDGSYRVQYEGDSRQTSSQFMWHVLNISRELQLTSTTGQRVVVPINASRTGQQFGADLWFTNDPGHLNRRLIVERSTHRQIYKIAANPEFTQWKKDLRAWLKDVLFVLSLRSVEADPIPGWRRNAASAVPYAAKEVMRKLGPWALFDKPPDENLVGHLQTAWDALMTFYHEADTPAKPARVALLNLCYAGYRGQTTTEPLPMFAETLPSRWTV